VIKLLIKVLPKTNNPIKKINRNLNIVERVPWFQIPTQLIGLCSEMSSLRARNLVFLITNTKTDKTGIKLSHSVDGKTKQDIMYPLKTPGKLLILITIISI
jgi:hypothetical protein